MEYAALLTTEAWRVRVALFRRGEIRGGGRGQEGLLAQGPKGLKETAFMGRGGPPGQRGLLAGNGP